MCIRDSKDFGLPKPSQNPFKMPSKSMSHKTCIFSSIFCLFWLFSALCAFSWKCLKPNKNCGFVVLRAYQYSVFVGSKKRKISKKPAKNHPKTRSEPFKKRCQKRVVFKHRFFGVSASIWEPLMLPSWSQVGF